MRIEEVKDFIKANENEYPEFLAESVINPWKYMIRSSAFGETVGHLKVSK